MALTVHNVYGFPERQREVNERFRLIILHSYTCGEYDYLMRIVKIHAKASKYN